MSSGHQLGDLDNPKPPEICNYTNTGHIYLQEADVDELGLQVTIRAMDVQLPFRKKPSSDTSFENFGRPAFLKQSAQGSQRAIDTGSQLVSWLLSESSDLARHK